jgi:hypothetical protein
MVSTSLAEARQLMSNGSFAITNFKTTILHFLAPAHLTYEGIIQYDYDFWKAPWCVKVLEMQQMI